MANECRWLRWCQTPHCSHSHSHTHITSMLLVHMQTHFSSPPHVSPASPLLALTYSDVEAVDAEGGTPTLSEAMLFGVGFHRFGTLRSPSCLYLAS